MPWGSTMVALVLASATAARAQAPAEPTAPAAVPATSAAVPGPPTPDAPAAAKRFSVEAGWGYYEVAHVGASYHPSERSAIALFGGYGLGHSEQDLTIGAAYSHAMFGPIGTLQLQPGWNLKAVYWQQSDDYYNWQNLSLVLGPYIATDLGNGLRVALDAGVALSFALETDRTQDFTFGHPQRWNGSVCLEISYRLGGR